MFNLGKTVRKFYCLKGFVAVIFSLFFLRSIYMLFVYPCFWNVLSCALLGIFAYWWVSSVIRPGGSRACRGYVPYNNRRDIDL